MNVRFVIDTNVLISALIKDSFTRAVLLYSGFEFYYPEISLMEIKKYEKMILKKTGLKIKEFRSLFSTLLRKIKIVPTTFFSDYLKKSEKIMRNIDLDDSVFLALALSLKVSTWSDDSDFDKQHFVENFKSHEVAKRFVRF